MAITSYFHVHVAGTTAPKQDYVCAVCGKVAPLDSICKQPSLCLNSGVTAMIEVQRKRTHEEPLHVIPLEQMRDIIAKLEN